MSIGQISTHRSRARGSLAVGAVAAVLLLAACGDDDGGDGTAPAGTEAPPATGESSAQNADLCALAVELNEQDSFPSVEQLERYESLAPDEIKGAVDTAVEPLMAAAGDPVAGFAAFAEDDVEDAIAEINAWETENCGVAHDENELAEGASQEIEEGAARVDVTSTDYEFALTEPVSAGRTSFVLTNDGAETHFLGILKLADGADLATALESDDGSLVEAYWQSGLAAPGGSDEEAITFDLEPGTYGLVCWISSADGTPHAMLGMTKELTVT